MSAAKQSFMGVKQWTLKPYSTLPAKIIRRADCSCLWVLIFLERPVTAEQLLSAIRIDSEALRLTAAERQPIVEELFTKIEYQLTKPGWNCVKKPQLDEPAINQTADELAHIANIRFVLSFEAPRLDQSGEMSIRVIANLAGRDITREVREDRFDRYPNRGKLLKIAAGSAVRELLDENGATVFTTPESESDSENQ